MLLGKGLTIRDFVEIGCNLNCWEWDDRLGEKPVGFDDMTYDQKQKIIDPFYFELQLLVSEYDQMRYWNVEHLKSMSPSEFDEFFSTQIVPRSVTAHMRQGRTNHLLLILMVSAIAATLVLGLLLLWL